MLIDTAGAGLRELDAGAEDSKGNEGEEGWEGRERNIFLNSNIISIAEKGVINYSLFQFQVHYCSCDDTVGEVKDFSVFSCTKYSRSTCLHEYQGECG